MNASENIQMKKFSGLLNGKVSYCESTELLGGRTTARSPLPLEGTSPGISILSFLVKEERRGEEKEDRRGGEGRRRTATSVTVQTCRRKVTADMKKQEALLDPSSLYNKSFKPLGESIRKPVALTKGESPFWLLKWKIITKTKQKTSHLFLEKRQENIFVIYH